MPPIIAKGAARTSRFWPEGQISHALLLFSCRILRLRESPERHLCRILRSGAFESPASPRRLSLSQNPAQIQGLAHPAKRAKEDSSSKKGSSRPEQRIVLHPLELSLTASRKVPAAYGRQAHNLERRRGREGSRLVQRRLRKENAAGGICLPGVATFDGHPHEQPCASDASFPHGRIPYREEPCIPSHSETGNSSS